MKYHHGPFAIFAGLLIACSSGLDTIDDRTGDAPRETTGEVENVILVIGDGMGPSQVGLLQDYARRAPNSIYEGRPSTIEILADEGVLGLASTGPHDALVVDSACSATHLATGEDALLEAIGANAHGDLSPTILELAMDAGKSTGLVSDTRITHATPAAFAAHISHRTRENEIAEQLLESGVDVMLSGGLRHFVPRGVNTDEDLRAQFLDMTGDPFDIQSSRTDDQDLLARAQTAGYDLSFDRKSLQESDGHRLLGLFSNSGMHDAITERTTRDDPERTEPSLVEMAQAAVQRLSRNEDGFFLMIEAGQIDWAGHDNDAGTLLHELLRLDETLEFLHQWADGRDDTLIIVAADHETGGFGFSYSAADLPEPQFPSGALFEDLPYAPNYNFGRLDILDGLHAQQMSFAEILSRFDAGEDHSPTALRELVNAHSAFPITEDDAAAILDTMPNPYPDADHPYLDAESVPRIDDFAAFYVYGDANRRNLLARAVSTQQNVVWSTGTHTHAPVPVIAWGPDHITKRFDRLLHLKDVGRIAIDALIGDR